MYYSYHGQNQVHVCDHMAYIKQMLGLKSHVEKTCACRGEGHSSIACQQQ